MLDIGAPIVAALSKADEATIAAIKIEVSELFHARNKEGGAILNYAALIINGNK